MKAEILNNFSESFFRKPPGFVGGFVIRMKLWGEGKMKKNGLTSGNLVSAIADYDFLGS